jgi:hypothetical protein
MNYLPGLASNCDPSYLSLPSSWDYRWELLAPATLHVLGHMAEPASQLLS